MKIIRIIWLEDKRGVGTLYRPLMLTRIHATNDEQSERTEICGLHREDMLAILPGQAGCFKPQIGSMKQRLEFDCLAVVLHSPGVVFETHIPIGGTNSACRSACEAAFGIP